MAEEETAMVQLIIGDKGKGKTKQLLDKVNLSIKSARGNIVYLDKSSKHMYDLNNKVRLIDVSQFPLNNSDEFVGFVCGIISQDHDLEEIYFDGFREMAKLEWKDITSTIIRLDEVSNKYDINMIISVSAETSEISDTLKDKVLQAL
jgi:hypothetical protein